MSAERKKLLRGGRGCTGVARGRTDERAGSEGSRARRRADDGNLLGSECNFIVNLSLSEGKQWSDLRTICPCHLCLHLA